MSSLLRTAPSAWRPWLGHRDTKAPASVASPGLSQLAAWRSVVTSTTSSASSPCTTMATRTAACSVPPARPSTESRLATNPRARWSTMSFPTRYPATLTAKPSGSFITSLLASRYGLIHVYALVKRERRKCQCSDDVMIFALVFRAQSTQIQENPSLPVGSPDTATSPTARRDAR